MLGEAGKESDDFFLLPIFPLFFSSSFTLHSLKHRSTTERRNANTAALAASVSSVGEMRSRSWSIRASGVAGSGGSGYGEGKDEVGGGGIDADADDDDEAKTPLPLPPLKPPLPAPP